MVNISEFIFGRRPEDTLPERVQASIARQQEESEKLIGWVQLMLALIFASLWAVSPPSPNTFSFQPVPWAVLFYTTFTLGRLIASYRSNLPDWLLILSVVMDMGLLMTLIWSFHIQYMQPPSFYLKAPTFMYVFIFISLRVLRFEPKYIFISGFAATVGWSILMAYVIYSDPDNMMITRDYVEYITSNAILIGAEIDKIISIGLVTIVLGIASLRGRRALIWAVLDREAAQDLSRFVSPEVAKRITQADQAIQPGDGEAVNGSVLFTDIEGFSSYSETVSPQVLAATLNDYFGAMSEVIDENGGVITQFQGDAMLIVFNALSAEPDHARKALQTALAIREMSLGRTFGDGTYFKTRCGISTGEIMVGAVGAKDRLVFTVHGDNVNIAARLEQLNKDHGTYILLTDESRLACGLDYEFRKVCDCIVRGREAPTTVYTVDPV
ncbi:MAG TPA: adenylate/guanylate cyclase domain-containing protein [Rhodospirillales bacterium]|nr:adenylate/guanylate cyclase domain-containing protein [Rhodospirillales bacterium]